MKETFHFWIGMPNSPSQLTHLLARLENAFPASRGRTQVVFENEILPISDLARFLKEMPLLCGCYSARIPRASGFGMKLDIRH